MHKEPSAKVIADSITLDGHRLTTFEVTMHRFVLAEFNTHRMFSRNSASSRAIPSHKQLSAVLYDPAMPIEWGTNQPGMQAAELLDEEDTSYARYNWVKASHAAVEASRILSENLNVHKQVANRILEPWMWHTVIVTAVEYDNFFSQRVSPLAQPEIRIPAEHMLWAYEESEPVPVDKGEYHLPYIQEEERDFTTRQKIQLSTARCARVSYLTHDGRRDIEKDFELYDRLVSAEPPHASPLEHVATPYPENRAVVVNTETGNTREVPILGNFVGWRQHRHEVANEVLLVW